MLLQRSAPDAPVGLREVLDVAGAVVGPGAVGMISSPVRHDLVRLDPDGGQLVTSSGPAELDDVFHLRLFTPEAELRWVHTGARRGNAVLLSEGGTGPAGWITNATEVDEVLDGQHALWGRRFTTLDDAGGLDAGGLDAAGWCRAIEGRIGWIDVPAATPATPAASDPDRDWPEQYLAVRFREYLTSDGYGNAIVLDERLIEITIADVHFHPGQLQSERVPAGGQG